MCKFVRGTSERRLCATASLLKRTERERESGKKEEREKLAMEEALHAIKWIVNIAAVCE